MAVEDSYVTSDERALDKRIEAAAWGGFLVWIGVALLAHVGWGVGFLGASLITFGAQAWRKHRGVRVDRFSLMIGALFAVLGVWNVFEPRVDIVPVLFIVAGIGLLASAWRARRAPGTRGAVEAPPPHPRV